MSTPDPSPREMARAFTPQLAKLVENPLYSDVWADPALSPRDRSIATVAALIALFRPEELPAHLRRARDNDGRVVVIASIFIASDSSIARPWPLQPDRRRHFSVESKPRTEIVH
jgi:alkylhydroperoxidase/carboxymuconolactone decarboxylase family protein YurZ